MLDAVLFDLDGTLTDSRLGITRCIQHALAEAGAVVPPIEELTRYVGPPLPNSFSTLLGTSDAQQIDRAIATYRSRFEQAGIFENRLYPGIAEMLEAFEADGHAMCVVTAKPRVYALRILEHFEIAGLFHDVYGTELGARNYTKASLIKNACAQVSLPPASRAVMIGDRAEDVYGARSNGIGSVAVTWGYGAREELEAAPDRIVASSSELREYISARCRPSDGRMDKM
jgi:phosphoglycolate phosphatase